MSAQTFLNGKVTLRPGDCLDVLKTLDDSTVDAVVTDPPYGIVFMGRQWDTSGSDQRAFSVAFWQEVYRVLKPGGHVIAASATRTYHRLAVAIEDAGFEIRDMVSWLYGSGFPKSHDVSKGIDKAAGATRSEVVGKSARHGGGIVGNGTSYEISPEVPDILAPATPEAAAWQGWGTALKPACEPWVLARKPLIGTVAANVLAHGTGALNIDGCRVAAQGRRLLTGDYKATDSNVYEGRMDGSLMGGSKAVGETDLGRWPANVLHDGSDEVVGAFPESNIGGGSRPAKQTDGSVWGIGGERSSVPGGATYGDTGSAARFFYSAKAYANDRIGSKHPTVKPVDLMQWLVRLITPKGGLVLDPFAGTGTTGEAAFREGMRAVLIEREPEYQADIARRMAHVLSGADTRRQTIIKAKGKVEADAGPLFGGLL
jgi:DNA modification methylase